MNLVPKESGSFKSFDDTRIYYEVRGTGPTLILNYGIGCVINHWHHQIRHFAQNYRVVTYDYRAHHRSEIPADRSQLNIEAMAQDLKYLMEHLEVQKASLWGHSFGAEVVLRHIDLHPDSAESLIFVNGFAQNPLQGMFGSDLTNKFFRGFKSGYQLAPETLRYLFRAAVTNPLAIKLSALAGGFNLDLTALKDIEIYARGIASLDLEAFVEMFESMIQYDGREVLSQIRVPTLIIGGKKDTVTPQKYQEELHVQINNSELFMVPYGSHCTQLDMPDMVNLKIQEFLEQHKK